MLVQGEPRPHPQVWTGSYDGTVAVYHVPFVTAGDTELRVASEATKVTTPGPSGQQDERLVPRRVSFSKSANKTGEVFVSPPAAPVCARPINSSAASASAAGFPTQKST